MYMEDQELLNQICEERNHTEGTKKVYIMAVKSFVKFHETSLTDIIKKAEEEEEEGVRWKNRTIRKRLIDYRKYVYKHYLKSTATMYFQRIISILQHVEIELHKLPPFSTKNLNQNPPTTFRDIPDKKILKKAIQLADNRIKAIILFSSSSGCAIKETLTITIQDFIEATKEYHNNGDIGEILRDIQSHDNVIPTFQLRRHKTNRYYYTFCSPEAVTAIISYLQTSGRNLDFDEPLFKIHRRSLSKFYTNTNDTLGLGFRGNRRILTSHSVRKYHSTILNNLGIFTESEVHFLQGRARGNLDEIYLLKDPSKLREKYAQCIDALQINWKYNLITVDSPEVQRMVIENKKLKSELSTQSKRLNKIESMINEYTYDEWKEIL